MLSIMSPTSGRLSRAINGDPLRFTRSYCISKLNELVFRIRSRSAASIGSDIGVGE